MTNRPRATFDPLLRRRTMLKACCGLALGLHSGARADEADDASAAPRAGDRLVHAFGDRAGQTISPADVVLDAQQLLGYPFDPAVQRVRDGTRLNQIAIVRVALERMTPETRARSAEGIVAYSGVCTHTGCDVTDWRGAERRFKCPCHESEFDPADGARVVGGPAPLPLAALPLVIVDGALTIAAAFEGYVGFMQPGLDGLSSP